VEREELPNLKEHDMITERRRRLCEETLVLLVKLRRSPEQSKPKGLLAIQS